ncbi:MAG: SHOCT domain-containing protein, partial [Solirubrobacterales bacterium]
VGVGAGVGGTPPFRLGGGAFLVGAPGGGVCWGGGGGGGVGAGAPPPPPPPTPVEQLQKLAPLRDSGVLTNEEFEAQKQKVLAGG